MLLQTIKNCQYLLMLGIWPRPTLELFFPKFLVFRFYINILFIIFINGRYSIFGNLRLKRTLTQDIDNVMII
jgi:hypothetical protein